MMSLQAQFRFLSNLTKLVYPTYNSSVFIIYMLVKFIQIRIDQQIRKLQPVSNKTMKELLKNTKLFHFDLNNVALVQKSASYVPNNLFLLATPDQSGQYSVRRRVKVVGVDLALKGQVLVSYSLFCNLSKSESCTLRQSSDNSVSFADEVEVGAVSGSVSEIGQFAIKALLSSYFKRPKLVRSGDLIEIDCEAYGEELIYACTLSRTTESVYFKVKKVVCKGQSVESAFCQAGETKLVQSVDLQGFLPRSYPFDEQFELFPCPYGLESVFEELKTATLPFVGCSQNSSQFRPIFLLEGRKGSGKALLVKCLSSYLGLHLISKNNVDLTANVYAQNETKLKNVFFAAKMAAPAVLEIRNFENFGRNNDGHFDERLITNFATELSALFTTSRFPLIVVCSTNEPSLPLDLRRLFLKTFKMGAPNGAERERHLRWILRRERIEAEALSCATIAGKTHGFLFEDLCALVRYAATAWRREADELGGYLPERCLLDAVELMQANYNESVGAPKVPKVLWSDIGGLTDVKDEIIKTIELPLKHPELLASSGLKRSGILLFGPPGTGKTLIAKAVATECGLCFLSVKGPELLNKYVGQSEQNVREVFERAREASPCIVFFDELDALAPRRGASGDSGGVMDRVVSQLLAEMDGLGAHGAVFVVGATNRPDLVDAALLRPGRFDRLLYVGPSADAAGKRAVLAALTRRFAFAGAREAALAAVVGLLPGSFSGADLYGVCSSAWMGAARRVVAALENGNGDKVDATSNDVHVTVDDFRFAIRNVKPSIRQADLDYFAQLRAELC